MLDQLNATITNKDGRITNNNWKRYSFFKIEWQNCY